MVPATHFVSCESHAWGGSPAYGSFRSYFCQEHADEWMERLSTIGHKPKLEALNHV